MQPMRHGQATPNSQARTTRTSQPSTRANSNQALGTDHFGAPISERATDSGLPSRPLQPSAPAIHGSSTPAYIRPNHDPYSHASQSVPEPGARIGGARSALVQRDHESRDSLAGSSRSTTAPNTLTEDRDHGMLTAGGNLHSGAETGTWVDRSHSLPADDGMHLLRRRIHAIRESSASSAEKARQIHTIMTEDYRSTLKVPDSLHPGAHCRATSQSTERPQTPLSSQSKRSSDQFTLTPASTSSSTYSASDGPYYLTMEDLTPTYATDVGTPTQDYNDGDLFSSQGQRVVGPLDGTCERDLGCQHYKRNVKLQCFTCKKWYTCRFCHDDAEEHALIRRKTENMLCMICETPQRAAQWCRNCGTQAACYYCGICKLWDNDASKRIYHCHDCGLCRRGEGLGKDFFHCKVFEMASNRWCF